MAIRALFAGQRVVASTAVVAASLLLFAASASAATHTWRVKSAKDTAGGCGRHCTLREAVMAADHAGGENTIIVPSGTYKLTIRASDTVPTPEDNPSVGDLDINAGVRLTIKGAGAAKTILNANHLDRMFAVQKGGSLTISGVTVENGAQSTQPPSVYSIDGGLGGGFYNDGSLTIRKSILRTNSAAGVGGAIYADSQATLTSVSDSTASQNSAGNPGGLLFATHGNIDLTGDTIEHNASEGVGGAIFAVSPGAVTVASSKIEYNNAGALYLDDTGKVSVTHTTLTHNIIEGTGGALQLDQTGTISITHSTISHNASNAGGAIYVTDSGAASVTDSTLSDNTATSGPGGAIFLSSSDHLTVSGSSFNTNTSEAGGAIDTTNANLSLTRSHFSANVANSGGAISLQGTGPSALQPITSSLFTDNVSVDSGGGAIDADGGDLSLVGSTFYGNHTGGQGGAVDYQATDAMSLVNDTFDTNTAEQGGALYLSGPATIGKVELQNDTIARNQALEGGGIYEPDNANVIENTIVAENLGTEGGGPTTGDGDCDYVFDWNSTLDNYTGTADAGYNLDSDHSCIAQPGGHPATGDKTANPKLGPLKNNGGPVPTDALLSGSPAIGAADKSHCPSTDARGVKRSGKCAIGAYQAAPEKKKRK